MRNTNTVDLGGGDSVKLLELRVKDIRAVMSVVGGVDIGSMELPKLLDQHGPPLVEALSECYVLTGYDSWEDLGMTDLSRVFSAFIDLNSSFFPKGEVNLPPSTP